MINRSIIFKIIGSLLFIEAILLLACLCMAVGYQEDDVLAFIITIILTTFTGIVLHFLGRHANNYMSRRDAYLVVTLSWIIFSLFGTFPFMISGYIPNFTDAYFETMSGFTTTGASIIDDVDKLPHGLLFWRSMTQWIGGLGIVFFTTAILPSFVGGSVKVFAAEATGPVTTRLHPRLSTNAKWIWVVYLVLTISCILSYMSCGMGWFDSINYAMGTTATGGFSTHTDSAEFFRSPAVEYIATFFCFISGTNFTLLYMSATHRSLKMMFKSEEFRFYTFVVIAFSLFIMAQLMLHNGYDLEKAFRCGIFQVVSFITTTGLCSDDAAKWPHVTWVVLAACMFLGGSSGSTSGGIKSIRGVMLVKIVKNEFRQILHPNAVLPMKIDGYNVQMSKRVTLLAFIGLYLFLAVVCAFTMIAAGIDSTNSMTITLSSLGNVGPTLGLEIGPTMSWNELPDFAKWISSFLMLVGRLELFSVLVLFTPSFWKEN